jgi:hypothetical protein
MLGQGRQERKVDFQNEVGDSQRTGAESIFFRHFTVRFRFLDFWNELCLQSIISVQGLSFVSDLSGSLSLSALSALYDIWKEKKSWDVVSKYKKHQQTSVEIRHCREVQSQLFHEPYGEFPKVRNSVKHVLFVLNQSTMSVDQLRQWTDLQLPTHIVTVIDEVQYCRGEHVATKAEPGCPVGGGTNSWNNKKMPTILIFFEKTWRKGDYEEILMKKRLVQRAASDRYRKKKKAIMEAARAGEGKLESVISSQSGEEGTGKTEEGTGKAEEFSMKDLMSGTAPTVWGREHPPPSIPL